MHVYRLGRHVMAADVKQAAHQRERADVEEMQLPHFLLQCMHQQQHPPEQQFQNAVVGESCPCHLVVSPLMVRMHPMLVKYMVLKLSSLHCQNNAADSIHSEGGYLCDHASTAEGQR
jgi:hypothetical protein